MITTTQVVRRASVSDERAVAALVHFGERAHRHLGWRSPLDYLGSESFWLVSQNGEVEAALAAPIEADGVAWLRLFACEDKLQCEAFWKILWPQAVRFFMRHRPVQVAALALSRWMRYLLLAHGFELTDEVVNLERLLTASPVPSAPRRSDVIIRAMQVEDLPLVARLDTEAFAPLWRNSLDDLRAAYEQCALATVAEMNETLVGYQIGSRTVRGLHIARLAVSPSAQRQGIGKMLCQHIMRQGYRRGMYTLSVNTQRSNAAALNLYKGLHFQETDDVFSVFVLNIK